MTMKATRKEKKERPSDASIVHWRCKRGEKEKKNDNAQQKKRDLICQENGSLRGRGRTIVLLCSCRKVRTTWSRQSKSLSSRQTEIFTLSSGQPLFAQACTDLDLHPFLQPSPITVNQRTIRWIHLTFDTWLGSVRYAEKSDDYVTRRWLASVHWSIDRLIESFDGQICHRLDFSGERSSLFSFGPMDKMAEKKPVFIQLRQSSSSSMIGIPFRTGLGPFFVVAFVNLLFF